MKKKTVWGTLLLVAYLLIVIWIILLKFSVSFDDLAALNDGHLRNINLIPFGDSVVINGKLDLKEIIYNAVIFIPFGGLLGIAGKNISLWGKVRLIILFSLSLEICQYIFDLGTSDITDLITNVFGGLMGLLIYALLKKLFSEEKLDKFLLSAGTLLFMLATGFVLFLIFFNR
ncbi:VanZ family protein [Enterococcus sp. LJL128]